MRKHKTINGVASFEIDPQPKYKKEITIGIDLDDTLVDLSSVIREKVLIPHQMQHIKVDWYFINFPMNIRNKVFKLFKEEEFMCIAKPLPGAIDTLKEWIEIGYKIVIITARHKTLYYPTYKMVKKYFPFVHELIITPSTESKKSVMLWKGIGIWIDDSPIGVEIGCSLNIPTFMIKNDYTTHTYGIKDKCPNVQIVNGIHEIEVEKLDVKNKTY